LHTIKKGTEALVVTSKETCIEVNDENLKYILMSIDQHAGQNHNPRINLLKGCNSSDIWDNFNKSKFHS
jgi:hypothetical protein